MYGHGGRKKLDYTGKTTDMTHTFLECLNQNSACLCMFKDCKKRSYIIIRKHHNSLDDQPHDFLVLDNR